MKAFLIKFFNAVKKFLTDNKDELIKPTVVLLLICIIIPLALAVTNMVTVDRIAKLEEEKSVETMEKLISADSFNGKESKTHGFSYNEAVKDGKIIAYIFKTSAKGYGGDVSVMTAISPEGKILDIAILDASNETPGLGQNVTKKEFYSQFKNKTGSVSIDEIDTVTGATFSSKAVTNAVNEARENFDYIENTIVVTDDAPEIEDTDKSEENTISETEATASEAK